MLAEHGGWCVECLWCVCYFMDDWCIRGVDGRFTQIFELSSCVLAKNVVFFEVDSLGGLFGAGCRERAQNMAVWGREMCRVTLADRQRAPTSSPLGAHVSIGAPVPSAVRAFWAFLSTSPSPQPLLRPHPHPHTTPWHLHMYPQYVPYFLYAKRGTERRER